MTLAPGSDCPYRSAAGSRSRAGTVRSGRWPSLDRAPERFTQAVRIPAALAPTLSNGLQVTSLTCPASGPPARPRAGTPGARA